MKKRKQSNIPRRYRWIRYASIATTSTMLAMGAEMAQAQGAPEAKEDAGTIVVSTSRIKRDGYSAPTPETVIGADVLAAAAAPNIADVVNSMPQVLGSATPRVATVSVSSGSSGSNFLNLRGLGNNRSLVLLDGRRVVGANVDQRVDINTLPSALISRVDIVTGGASAAWGSDAVAGVVNFILDKKFTGYKVDVQDGVSSYGDDKNHKIDVAAGVPFADGLGHFLISASESKTDGVARSDSRAWYSGAKIISNPAFKAGNGQPRLIVVQNANLSGSSLGGLITTGPLAGTDFGAGGTYRSHVFGQNTGIYSIGGERNDLGAYVALDIPVKQDTAFARASYKVTPDTELFAEFNYGKSVATADAPYNFHLANLSIKADNAFLPAALASQLTPGSSFTYGTFNADLGQNSPDNERELLRYVIGANGKFGGGWRWDAYAQYGRTHVLVKVNNVEVSANYKLAIDAVKNPSGTIVCRSTLTNPTNGCVPYNPFGIGVNQAPAIAYVTGVPTLDLTLEQTVGAGSIQGEPFSTWAGPVSVVAGGEYRTEKVSGTSDPLSQLSGYNSGNYRPTNGQFDVYEGFVEALVPLLRDKYLAKSLDFNAAYRDTHYSTSGTIGSWKLGATYKPIADLNVRTTRSRDIRAPNLNDLYQGGVSSTAQAVFDPRTGVQNANIAGLLVGNPTLRAETANTINFGIVYQPSWLPGFNASVDHYDIRIHDAIAVLTNQQIVDRCYAGNAMLCGFVTRNASGIITNITRSGINVAEEATRGFDLEASYKQNLSSNSRLTYRALATHTITRTVNDGQVISEQVGMNTGGIPNWRTIGSVRYDHGPYMGMVTVRHVSSGVYDNSYTQADLANNYLPGATYYDLAFAYKTAMGNSDVEFYLKIDNVLNKDPVQVAGLNQIASPQNPQLYDTLGRLYRAGVRLAF